MAKALGIPVRSISRLPQNRMDEGQVVSSGEGRWTIYRLKEQANGGGASQKPQARATRENEFVSRGVESLIILGNASGKRGRL